MNLIVDLFNLELHNTTIMVFRKLYRMVLYYKMGYLITKTLVLDSISFIFMQLQIITAKFKFRSGHYFIMY